ncbi:MAG: hypothetical protein J7K54_05090 [Candidatus Aenigmarchaeota archaeon]|nr:hypothetical protein [Candidatus Aenigmarchaeota archaeon]
MLQYIFSPRWFYGIDIVFELFSIVVVAMIARYGHMLYGVTHNKKHRYFSVFFLLIGIAFIFKIISNFNIYYLETGSINIENSVFYFQTSHISEILFTIGFSIFRFLMAMAFFGLLFINWKTERGMFYLCLYFIVLITIFSHSAYFVFHITMVVFMTGILAYYLKRNAAKTPRNMNLLLTPVAFFVLLLSQMFFILTFMNLVMYVIGEVLQLAGFLILMYEYVLVRRYEK